MDYVIALVSRMAQHKIDNRMEIMAAIAGLHALKHKCAVTIYSDSKYVVDAIMKGWAVRWRTKGWKRTPKTPRQY